MSLRKTLLAATVLMAPAIAQAQPVNGIYVAAGAGFNWLNNVNETTYATVVSGRGFGGAGPITVGTDYGWTIVGSIGWGFGNGLRIEGEMNYRTNDVNSFSVAGSGNIPGSGGTISTYGVMVNALYDIGATMGWPVHITLGGGIGYAWNRWSNVGFSLASGPASQSFSYDDTAGAFAYQFIGGLSLPIRQVPGLYLTAEYRYFATLAANISGTALTSNGETAVLSNLRVKPNNENQSLLIGVRYNFGRTPPAPPPAVVPAPASSFIVFFDFNRDDLTARAREIVAQAAAAARSQQVTRIEVAGHTDTVGSAQYNQGLSQRRANSVAAELVRLGVPRTAIQTAGYGFTRPLVQTGPNVREPQNRRVEIVLR